MEICPVCKENLSNMLCHNCGFDTSCDYEHYPTLGKFPTAPKAISHFKNVRAQAHKNLLCCPGCQKTHFSFLLDELSFVCLNCGAHISNRLVQAQRQPILQAETAKKPSANVALSPYPQIVCGSNHTVLLHTDGTVTAVGNNTSGQCQVNSWKDIVAISAGEDHTVGLRKDGTVVAVGSNANGQCTVINWRDIVAISAGMDHTVGLRKDGTVVATGDNQDGQCNVTHWNDIIAVSAGSWYTAGLRKDGTVVTVGFTAGQWNGWKDIVAVSAGEWHTVGLCKDGTVVAVGDKLWGQCNVSDWKDIAAISTGKNHTVGLHTDGTLVATGDNKHGQCDVQKLSRSHL